MTVSDTDPTTSMNKKPPQQPAHKYSKHLRLDEKGSIVDCTLAVEKSTDGGKYFATSTITTKSRQLQHVRAIQQATKNGRVGNYRMVTPKLGKMKEYNSQSAFDFFEEKFKC